MTVKALLINDPMPLKLGRRVEDVEREDGEFDAWVTASVLADDTSVEWIGDVLDDNVQVSDMVHPACFVGVDEARRMYNSSANRIGDPDDLPPEVRAWIASQAPEPPRAPEPTLEERLGELKRRIAREMPEIVAGISDSMREVAATGSAMPRIFVNIARKNHEKAAEELVKVLGLPVSIVPVER
jgi:hypothetical protein